MKPVSVVEVYTTKLCHSLSVEKMYCNESAMSHFAFAL